MSIELLKKDELVKKVRELTQELKLSEARVVELESLSKVAEKAAVEANNESQSNVASLPYLAVSIIKISANEHRVIQIRYDLNGNAVIDNASEKIVKEGYRASYEAAKLMETIVANQEEPKPEVVTESEEVVDENNR